MALPVLLGLIIWVPNGWGLLFLTSAIALLAMLEFFKLTRIAFYQPITIYTLILAVAVFVLASRHFQFHQPVYYYLPLVMLAFPLASVISLWDVKSKHPYKQVSLLLSTVWYIAIPMVLWFATGFRMLSETPYVFMDIDSPFYTYEWQRPLGILFSTWIADTSAYFVGRAFGKRKLWPRISPGKSWEGALGAFLGCILFGLILNTWFKEADCNWVVVGVVVMTFGLLGDLVESLLKRSAHAKDSGSFLPGHGGILDRFDGLLIAMPFVAAYFYLLAIDVLPNWAANPAAMQPFG